MQQSYMNRAYQAAQFFNDPSIVQIYEDKFNRKQSRLKSSGNVMKKITPAEIRQQQNFQAPEFKRVNQNVLKGKLHPINYKATLQRPYKSSVDLQQSTEEKPKVPKTSLPIMQQLYQQEAERVNNYKFDTEEIGNSQEQQTKDDTLQENILYKSARISTDINHQDHNLLRLIKSSQRKNRQNIEKQQQDEQILGNSTTRRFYAKDLFESTPERPKTGKDIKISRQQARFITNILNNEEEKDEEQDVPFEILVDQLNQRLVNIKNTLNQKLDFKAHQLQREVKQLRQKLKQQKVQMLDKIVELNKNIEHESLLFTQRSLDQYYNQSPPITEDNENSTDAKSQQSLSNIAFNINPALLTTLQNYMLLLSSAHSLWMERGFLGCQGCMKYLGFADDQLSENLDKIQSNEHQDLEDIKSQINQSLIAVSTQIIRQKQTSNQEELDDIIIQSVRQDSMTKSQTGEIKDGNSFILDNQITNKESKRPNTQKDCEELILTRDLGGDDITKDQLTFQKTTDIAQDSRTSTIKTVRTASVQNLRTQKFSPGPFKSRRSEFREPQDYNQKEERYVIFPCGDSICSACKATLKDQCPVCFGPVKRVTRAKMAVFNSFFNEIMQKTEEQLRLLAILLGDVVKG